MKKIIYVIVVLVVLSIIYILINYDNYKLKNLYNDPIKENETYDKYIYNEYNNHIGIMFYEGDEDILTIPEYINNKKVLSIDDSAFYGNAKIKKVIIPKYVIRIGHQ